MGKPVHHYCLEIEMNTYKTTNIYLAAALVSLGAELEDIDHTDRRHQVFFLAGRLDFSVLETAWFDGRLNGNLCRYKDALQKLKSKIHAF